MTTIKELKDYCRKHKLQKWSRLSKIDLEKFVNTHKRKKTKFKTTKKKTISKPKRIDIFDRFYKKTGAKIYQARISIEKKHWDPLQKLNRRAKEKGFLIVENYGLSEIDMDVYGYQVGYKFKRAVQVSKVSVRKIEKLIDPFRKYIYTSSIRYSIKTKNYISDSFFYGTTIERVERQIEKELKKI